MSILLLFLLLQVVLEIPTLVVLEEVPVVEELPLVSCTLFIAYNRTAAF